MKTYVYTTQDCGRSGFSITVYRIVRNRPRLIGITTGDRRSWRGSHGEAANLIHEREKIPFADSVHGGYKLRGELGPAHKYDDHGQPRGAVRIFEV